MEPALQDPPLRVIVFSKDRPLQVHATLQSLWETCTDRELLDVRVLAYASDDEMARRYGLAASELPFARFVPEQGFKDTLLTTLRGERHVCFVCDDAVFVRPWSSASALRMLDAIPKAIGVSLRLGLNTTQCYSYRAPQAVPPSLELIEGWRAFDWPEGELDFHYPLEVSSSIFRLDDLWSLLDALPYGNPNQLEEMLAARAEGLAGRKPALVYPTTSIAFCVPLNLVQATHQNRHADQDAWSAEALGLRFDEGLRVDTSALRGYTPVACHEELELPLRPRKGHGFERAGAASPPIPGRIAGAPRSERRLTLPSAPSDPLSSLAALRASGAWRDGDQLRIHLGCGERRLDNYVNVDLPPGPDSIMDTQADVFGDVPELRFPHGSVDEVRCHHVFEHFPRVEALALLIRWHEWLRPGGRIVIETPDLEGSARTLLSDQPLQVKLGVVRHLAGDQAESWAFHVDHWFPERFRHTLSQLGFGAVAIEQRSWPHSPFLSDVVASAEKVRSLSRDELIIRADALLAEATVSPAERPTLERWMEQLRSRLADGPALRAAVSELGSPQPRAATPALALPVPWFAARSFAGPLAEVVDFNQRARDRWVAGRAASLGKGERILDVGAGTCPYRPLFSHCDYVTHDFKQYEGVKLGGGTDYGRIDLVSDLLSIPAPDASFDAVLCTEVLEHVPRPADAVREMARLLRPEGRLFLTAPLGSGLHQLPFHYYGGFSPEWYRDLADSAGLEILSVTPNGGFFKLMAQELARAGELLSRSGGPTRPPQEILNLLGDLLPRWFFALDNQLPVDQFTVGYFVEARRMA